MAKKKEKEILELVFNINYKIKLDPDEKELLDDIEEQLYPLLEQEGEDGIPKIREIIIDELLKRDEENLMNYLNINIGEEIGDTLKNKLSDESFLKIEETENKNDFFNKYLEDDTINDLIMSLRGYDRSSEGTKEIFIKRRESIIPTQRIVAINGVLVSQFNKTSFLSEKDDLEQAKIIMLCYSLIFDILLEINYECCDTQRTIEILSIVVIKLSNMIGIGKGFRSELMDVIKVSYSSQLKKKDSEDQIQSD